MMQNKWRIILGVISGLIGIIILSASYLIGRFIPGGFLLLVLGIILILNSRE